MLLHSRVAVAAPRRARVEIIPLIDVIFFLLATFVLFTLSMNSLRSLSMVLPKADGQKHPENPDQVAIQVSADGVVYWNKELIEPAQVPARLQLYKTQTDNPRVLISGDERARFGPVIAVFDEVRRAGITSVSVETKPRQTGK